MEPIDESLVSPPFRSITVTEVNTPPPQRMYRIICLKRSSWSQLRSDDYISDWFNGADIVYWRPNYAGYTDNIDEAGVYTLSELDGAAGSHLDWFASPVWPHRL